MKALQLVPAMEEGGVERYVVQLNRFLVGDGWENVVVSRGGSLADSVVRDGGRTVCLDLKSKNPLTAPVRAWRLRRLLVSERPDVVCAHSRVPAWLFAMASRGLGIRFITYAHGANSISRYSRVMTCGETVMCPSGFVRDYLAGAYGIAADRFRVVPHGVDSSRFDPAATDAGAVAALRREWGIAAGEPVVMSVGRLTRLKGFDTLLRAMPLLKHRVRLVIVGGAEKGREAYAGELAALAQSLGIADRVTFAGRRTDTPTCLAIADVVVSANTLKPESFGLSMVEALAMGKPVVAKAFGGALDIVRDGRDGVLVAEGTPAEFASAIDRVLDDEGGFVADRLHDEAVSRFDISRMREGTLAVYRCGKRGCAVAH